MAILIDTSVNVLGGYEIPSLYLRMFYSHDLPGNSIHVSVEKYISKQSYNDNRVNSLQEIQGIPHNMNFGYIRSVDGIDTLGFAHKKLKEFLSTDQTQEVAMIDPSTGEMILDPSTNDPIYETVIVAPKFAPADKIYFIDVDPSIV